MSNKPSNNFSTRAASEMLEIARLPEIYEETLHKSGIKDAWKGNNLTANKAAYSKMLENASPEIRNNIQVVQHDNTTVIITYNPENHSATVTFDPTSQRSNVMLNADEMDNMSRGHVEHSLGGDVHNGLYRDLVEEGSFGDDNLIDRVSGVLHEHAYKEQTPLSVNFTGFSKGGSQAALAAGEMIENGLFDYGNNIEIGDVMLFATPAYGDTEFVETFNNKIEELGAKAWTIELHGDKVPTALTPEADSFFTRYDYSQVGERVYIDKTGEAIISPDKETLQTLRNEPTADEPMHNTKQYSDAIASIDSSSQDYLNESYASVAQPSITPSL